MSVRIGTDPHGGGTRVFIRVGVDQAAAVRPVPARVGTGGAGPHLATQPRLGVPCIGSECEKELTARYRTARGGHPHLHPCGYGSRWSGPVPTRTGTLVPDRRLTFLLVR